MEPKLSDHSPVVVQVKEDIKIGKRFSFLNSWIHHPKYGNIVKEAWNSHVVGSPIFRLFAKLKRVKHALATLHKDNYSNFTGTFFFGIDKANLIREISSSEIKASLFSIDFNSSPGIDAFSSGFFTSSWDIIERDLYAAVCSFFKSGRMVKQANCTLISLIPKKSIVASVLDYKPISCWNVPYVIAVKETLSEFALLSGLHANVVKTNIYFGGVSSEATSAILQATGFSMGQLPFKYFGISLSTSRVSVSIFDPLITKIQKSVLHWSFHSLTYGGKIQLLNSVVFGIDNYWCGEKWSSKVGRAFVLLGQSSYNLLYGCSMKLATQDNIQKRGFQFASRCCLCETHVDDHDHLFFSCSFSANIWGSILTWMNLPNITAPLSHILASCLFGKNRKDWKTSWYFTSIAAAVNQIWWERDLRTFCQRKNDAVGII
ncbi:uncharacterized protein LOC141614397 [Silene latifolia]|uniref:uncharacterized protein LOC141614397 n=1 Tax=Silene latifolia TaxID=37657 RepID=UPI003D780A9E